MLKVLRRALRWVLSLNNKLWRVVPGYTIVSVAATISSQLALLSAFFLPLKVILLLGSDRVPRYFPEIFVSLDRDWLIVTLSSAALLFYFAHMLAERVAELSTAAGAKKLLLRSRKMDLFDNQNSIALRAYHRYSQALASLVFVFIFLPLLSWLNPLLGVVFFVYIVLVAIGALVACSVSLRFCDFLLSNLSKLCAMMAGLGFLVCFVCMVIEFLWFTPPSILVGVVCLLLFRQLFRHISTLIRDLSELIRKRSQISALFFHSQKFVDPSFRRLEGLWALIEPNVRDAWVIKTLSDMLREDINLVSIIWVQLGIPDLVCYQVCVSSRTGKQTFLLKVFNTNRSALAKHEATLLIGRNLLPTLELLKTTLIGEAFHCHVFSLTGVQQLKTKGDAELAATDVAVKLLGCQADQELISLFTRSKPSLSQRLNRAVLQRLRYLISSEEKLLQLDAFDLSFEEICKLLSELPLVVINPDIKKGNLFQNEAGEALVGHWSRWSLEPIGSGWPVDAQSLAKLDKLFNQAMNHYPELSKIRLSTVRLAALLFAFDRFCQRQDYDSALGLIPSVIDSLR